MTPIKIIIFVAISYCCWWCSVISCATGDNFEFEAGPSTGGNPDSDSQRAELDRLGKLLFLTRNDFNGKNSRILETDEVKPLLNEFANLQERVIAGQPDLQLQNEQEQPQNRWINSALQLVVGALREFISLVEEENEEKMAINCENAVIMDNVKETSLLMAVRFPSLSKFAEENRQRIIQKCLDLKAKVQSGAGPSTGASEDTLSQLEEMQTLGRLLFVGRSEFIRDNHGILEPDEVRSSLNRLAILQNRYIAGQTVQERLRTYKLSHNRWTNRRTLVLVRSLADFNSRAEEENAHKIRKTCGSISIMEEMKRTRLSLAHSYPKLYKFTEENYERIIEKCVKLLKTSFDVFVSLLHDKQHLDGQDFGRLIGLSIEKLRLLGSEDDRRMERMAFAEAAARFVETFGSLETTSCAENTNEVEFKNHFIDRTRYMMDAVCKNIREYLQQVFMRTVNVLVQIEASRLESLDNFDKFKDWMSVPVVCQYWPHTISPEMVYDAHVSFHMDLQNTRHLKFLSDSLFSSSASRINDPNEIHSRLELLRDQLTLRANTHTQMFELNVLELTVLVGIKNRNSESADLMQQIEPLIRYYGSIEAHNIVYYLNSLINEQTGDSLHEIEAILRAGSEQLASHPQINENLRELRRFLPVLKNIGDVTGSDILIGLTDYFLSDLRNFERISDVNDHQSRKDLITRWFNQFMDDNCQKYIIFFNHTSLGLNISRSAKTLSGLDDELKLVLFNIILCSNMYNNILNHNDELTRLISTRVDGGGPSDQIHGNNEN